MATAKRLEYCERFRSGKCKKKEKCKFAHLCTYYQDDRCRNGANCPNKHIKYEELESNVDEPPLKKRKLNENNNNTNNNNNNNTNHNNNNDNNNNNMNENKLMGFDGFIQKHITDPYNIEFERMMNVIDELYIDVFINKSPQFIHDILKECLVNYMDLKYNILASSPYFSMYRYNDTSYFQCIASLKATESSYVNLECDEKIVIPSRNLQTVAIEVTELETSQYQQSGLTITLCADGTLQKLKADILNKNIAKKHGKIGVVIESKKCSELIFNSYDQSCLVNTLSNGDIIIVTINGDKMYIQHNSDEICSDCISIQDGEYQLVVCLENTVTICTKKLKWKNKNKQITIC